MEEQKQPQPEEMNQFHFLIYLVGETYADRELLRRGHDRLKRQVDTLMKDLEEAKMATKPGEENHGQEE